MISFPDFILYLFAYLLKLLNAFFGLGVSVSAISPFNI